MDVQAIFNAGGVVVKNPNYSKSNKNSQPEYITVADMDNISKGSTGSGMADIMYKATPKYQHVLGEEKDLKKYNDYGITPNVWETNLDKQLAEKQGAGEKLWNAAKQTVVSELLLGIPKGFSDLFDYVSSGFDPDDYSNPLSEWLKQQQEAYKAENPIFVDPDVNIANGGLTDMGWIASNLPSVASTLTLLVPGMGVSKGLSFLGNLAIKGKSINNIVGFTRRALTGLKNFDRLSEVEQAAKLENLGTVAKWVNTRGKDMTNAAIEMGINAATMRAAENYQEAQDTYQQMYEQASDKFKNMSDDEFNAYLQQHPELNTEEAQSKDDVARLIAKQSADKTFTLDAWNFAFDFFELSALKEVGKLAKSVTLSSSVRKASRIARQQAAIDAGLMTEKDIKTGIINNIGNYLSDHRGSGKVLLAELSEGAEEAINYISQQEGLHYGNVMLDNEQESMFSNRLHSYLKSPELYDAAFWGWMGGILFQGVGGKLKQFASNTIDKYTANRNNKNDSDKTGEKSTTWDERWESATSKRQVEEINGRLALAEEARRKLDMLADEKETYGKNPYETLEDGVTPKPVTSESERQALRERVRDEYITDLTIKAIDSGTYDDLMLYLHDDGVKAKLKQFGIEEEGNEQVIAKMEEVANRYENNLLAINTISGAMSGGVPMEYQQIIARDNTYAQLSINDIDRRLQQYNSAAEHHRLNVFSGALRNAGFNPDDDSEYRTSVFLAEASQRLGELKAQKKALLANKETSGTLDAQDALRLIDRQIDAINKQLTDSEDTMFNLARLVWAHGVATNFVYDETTGKTKVVSNTDESAELLDALNQVTATHSFGSIIDLESVLGIDFAKFNNDFLLTDNEIVKLFGDENGNGAYQTLKGDMQRVYPLDSELKKARDEQKGLRNAAPLLHEDYINISALQFAKIYHQALINNTKANISRRVQELDNYMNEARKKALNKSYEIIDRLGETYDIHTIMDYVNNPNDEDSNEVLSDKDKKDLDSALEIINLKNEANAALRDEILYRLIRNKTRRDNNAINESAVTGENSSTSEQEISEPQTQQPINTPQPTQQTPTPTQNGQNTANNQQQQPSENLNGKLQLYINVSGDIQFRTVADTDENTGVHHSEDADGNITLDYKEQPNLVTDEAIMPEALFNKLFNITDNRPSGYSGEHKITIAGNPIIKKDDNGKWQVVQKGDYVISSNNPSTGGQAENSTTPSSSNEGQITPEEKAAEEKQRDYHIKVQQAFSIRRKEDSFKNKPIEEQLNIIIDQIQKSGLYKEEDKEYLNNAITVLANLLQTKGLITDVKSAIANLILQSSITENTETKFADDFIKAANSFVEFYAKKVNLPTINGKTYINLENALRDINNEYQDKSIAELVYKSLVNYVTSDLGKQQYIVTDDNPKHPDFIENVRKSLEQRIAERVASEDIHRVNIDSYFEQGNKSFLQAFDKLKKGDVLTVKKDEENGRIYLQSNGVTIGDIPLAKAGARGGYVKTNLGWITDVSKDKDTIDSDLKNALSAFIKDANNIETLKQIWRYSYDTSLNKQDKARLMNDIYNELAKQFTAYIDKNAEKKDVVEFISRIMKYVEPTEVFDADDVNYLNATLNNLFNTYYESYALASELYNSNGTNFTITVDKITEGQINHVITEANDANNYKNMNYVDQAIDDKHKNGENGRTLEIGFVNPISNEITLTNRSITRHGLRKGSVYVVMSNGSEESHVIGTAVRLSDDDGSKTLKDLNKAIRDELSRKVEKAIENPLTDWQNLIKYLYQLTGKQASGWNPTSQQRRDFPTIIPIFAGLNWYIKSGKDNETYLNINVKNKGIVQFSLSDKFNTPITQKVIKDGEEVEETNYINYDITTKEGQKALRDIINKLQQYLVYNITESLVRETNTSNDENQLYQIGNGSFNLSIPNSETGVSYQVNATGFTDFVMKTGIVKVDTFVGENGSNYERKGTNQKANQLLNVSIARNGSRPVEEMIVTSAEQDTKDILNDVTIKNKGRELLKDSLSEQTLNTLDTLHLLPESIIFVENFNTAREENGVTYYDGDNAEINLNTKTVTVGNRWVSMFNETGEFAGTNGAARKQAIRKLIHEALHARLHEKGYEEYIKKIKTIYNEFKSSLNNATDEQKANLEKYLKLDEPDVNIRLEEFLVESLTSGELVQYLNSVEAKGETKKDYSLWDKFLQLFNELFDFVGFEVKKGSLFEKELDALQKAFNKIEKPAKQLRKRRARPSKNKKTATPKYVEGTLEFKEEEEQKPAETPKEESAVVPLSLDALAALGTEVDDTRGSSITEGINIANNYTSEMQSIKDKAIADGTFMKAPNGNPTNLNERQWLQVRTKAFKDWFGDWEKEARFIYDLYTENGARFLSYEERNKIIDDYNSGKDIEVYAASNDVESLLKGNDFRKSSKSYDLNTQDGILYTSYTLNYAKDYGNQYANQGIDLDKIGLVKIIINKNNNNNAVSFTESEVRINSNNVIKSIEKLDIKQNRKQRQIHTRNWKNVSKVVDENGEPLVVYHETDIEWDTFDPSYNIRKKYGTGLYTTTRNELSGHHGDIQMSLFLNIRKPLEGEPLIDDNTINDGVIVKHSDKGLRKLGTWYVAPKSNQIKSANDNVGTFSTTDDNIRHSSITEKVTYTIPNMKSLSDRLPIAEQAKFLGKMERGEHKLSCSI